MEGMSTEGLPFCGTTAQSLYWDYSLSQRVLPTQQTQETIIHAFWLDLNPRSKESGGCSSTF